MFFVVKCHDYTMKFPVSDYYIMIAEDGFSIYLRSSCKCVYEIELSNFVCCSLEPLSPEEVL